MQVFVFCSIRFRENVNHVNGNVSNSASVSSREVGRLPTPQLRALGGAQRTHHDLTTPATGKNNFLDA